MPVSQLCKQASGPASHTAARASEDHGISKKIPKRGAVSSDLPKPFGAEANPMRPGRKGSVKNTALPALKFLKFGPAMGPKMQVFLEIFSGCGQQGENHLKGQQLVCASLGHQSRARI